MHISRRLMPSSPPKCPKNALNVILSVSEKPLLRSGESKTATIKILHLRLRMANRTFSASVSPAVPIGSVRLARPVRAVRLTRAVRLPRLARAVRLTRAVHLSRPVRSVRAARPNRLARPHRPVRLARAVRSTCPVRETPNRVFLAPATYRLQIRAAIIEHRATDDEKGQKGSDSFHHRYWRKEMCFFVIRQSQ